MPDTLTPETLAPLLRNTIFGRAENIHYFRTTGSTNALAIEAAADGAEEGSIFLADEQTAGRGRGGHDWHSEASGGVYLSVLLRPNLNPTDVLWLSLITGLSAHYGIESVLGTPPDLRWPNDIMLGNRKLGGILTEMQADSTHVRHVVVGVGINVNQPSFPREIADIATSMRMETGRDWPRTDIAAALLKSLDREYRTLRTGLLANVSPFIVKRFEQRSTYARGANVAVEEAGGFTGETVGLDARGFLRVKTDDGVKTVLSGGVRKVSTE
ncbi:MAG TPA: biotin--[acetyl-CoA-carboxylase] ligase [Terriglobales bacterium]|nr:biotin--[acetyl-CoA-carboxylase] ligase [Terriglobales bacterium]